MLTIYSGLENTENQFSYWSALIQTFNTRNGYQIPLSDLPCNTCPKILPSPVYWAGTFFTEIKHLKICSALFYLFWRLQEIRTLYPLIFVPMVNQSHS